MTKPLRAIIFARVSTDEQFQEGYSIPAQLTRSRDYCARKNLRIHSEYQFEESSTKDQRKKFESVVAEIKKAKTTIALIVETIDRLQRSFKESVMLDSLIKTGKLEIHFIRENLIIHKNSNSSEIQRWDLGVFVAKSYVLQLSDNVKRSIQQKLRNGECIGRVPLGYKNLTLEDGSSSVVIDSDRAPLVKKMFLSYADGGKSVKTVLNEAHNLGLRRRDNKALGHSTAHRMLKNPFYIGIQVVNGKAYPHKYPPLITKELYDRVQVVMSRTQRKPAKHKGKAYTLKGNSSRGIF